METDYKNKYSKTQFVSVLYPCPRKIKLIKIIFSVQVPSPTNLDKIDVKIIIKKITTFVFHTLVEHSVFVSKYQNSLAKCCCFRFTMFKLTCIHK